MVDIIETAEFSKWLRRLKDREARRRINSRLSRVRLGNFGDHKSVSAGLYELRVAYGPGYRVYYAHAGKTLVVLIGGGDKSSQDKDVKAAKQRMKDLE